MLQPLVLLHRKRFGMLCPHIQVHLSDHTNKSPLGFGYTTLLSSLYLQKSVNMFISSDKIIK